jgi:hypothetical protein
VTGSGFTASASGTVREASVNDELSQVEISLSLAGPRLTALGITLLGQPLENGGLQMSSSSVTLGTSSNPGQYRGHVTSLSGTDVSCRVSDGAGNLLNLSARLRINSESGTATGTVTARP